MMRARAGQSGMTLVELVISIVVIAIAAGAVLGVLATTTEHSADAMVLRQAVAVGEAYLEEIALKPLADPDGVTGEGARAAFDDVYDYDGLVDAGAVDQVGNAIGALSGYTVAVAVTPTAALPGIGSTDAARIDVNVRFPPSIDLLLTAYRTRP